MKTILTACLMAISLSGCDKIKQLTGTTIITVENQLIVEGRRVDGVQIYMDGSLRFTLNYGQSKKLERESGVATITASHPSFSTDPEFNLVIKKGFGGEANIILSARKILNQDVPRFTCSDCESIL